jgi:hypothetical protein
MDSDDIIIAGSIGIQRTDGILGEMIRTFEQARKEARSWASHAFIVTTTGTMDTAELVEAQGKGVDRRPLSAYSSRIENGNVLIWEPITYLDTEKLKFTKKEIQNVVKTAGSYAGQMYNFAGFFASAFDRIFYNNKVKFRKWCNWNKTKICSEVVSYAYYSGAKYKFLGMGPKGVSPDDIMDHLVYLKPREFLLRK